MFPHLAALELIFELLRALHFSTSHQVSPQTVQILDPVPVFLVVTKKKKDNIFRDRKKHIKTSQLILGCVTVYNIYRCVRGCFCLHPSEAVSPWVLVFMEFLFPELEWSCVSSVASGSLEAGAHPVPGHDVHPAAAFGLKLWPCPLKPSLCTTQMHVQTVLTFLENVRFYSQL